MPTPSRDDRGSLLLLQAFLISVVVAAVLVLVDVAAVIHVRHQLAATADQAALVAAQAIDPVDYYRGAAVGGGRDPAQVEQAVRRYLAPAITEQQHSGLAVRDIGVRDGQVFVALSARADLPFAAVLGIADVPVQAEATARLHVRPTG